MRSIRQAALTTRSRRQNAQVLLNTFGTDSRILHPWMTFLLPLILLACSGRAGTTLSARSLEWLQFFHNGELDVKDQAIKLLGRFPRRFGNSR